MRRSATTEIEYMREILRSALWDVVYYEHSLKRAHENVALARAVMVRINFQFSDEEAIKTYLDCNDGDDVDTVDELVRCLIGRELNSVRHFETSLKVYHGQLALAKALWARANMPEISFDEIVADVNKQLEPEE